MNISKSEKIPNPCEGKDNSCYLEKVEITINGIKMKVKKGTTILDAAKNSGIIIPTLCHHPDLKLAGICRVCTVEVDGKLEASCSYAVSRPVDVITHSNKIRESRKAIVELLLTKHDCNCLTCHRNLNCELQNLANELGVDMYRYGKCHEKRFTVDNTSHSIIRDMDKCILCRRCVRTCIDLQGVGCYHVEGRGEESYIDTFAQLPMESVFCINCGQCVNRCPTGALIERDQTKEVFDALEDPNKVVIIQTAPAPRSSIGECFSLPPGMPLTYEMNTALKTLGFDYVFDTCFSADLTIIEEGTELLTRLKDSKTMPMFTSCSPGWIKYLEHFYPQFIPNLSTVKSPQQIFGTLIKTYFAKERNIDPKDIVTVALMPCTAKKFEADREEINSSDYKDIDYGITTRELAKMIKQEGIDLPHLKKTGFDNFFFGESGSGVIFGSSGGVMESAVRSLFDIITGKSNELIKVELEAYRENQNIRYYELPIEEVGSVPALLSSKFKDFNFLKEKTLRLAVVHGTANAKIVLDSIKEGGFFSGCHFIEFMACEDGCIGGGGQAIPTSKKIRKQRAKALYRIDSEALIRNSYENPAVLKTYKEFITNGPNSLLSHKYLHTTYVKRGHEYDLDKIDKE